MNWHEEVLAFACEDEQLVGIVTSPDVPGDAGVVIVVGGPQYRAGSHRQFVSLARRLASAGLAVLRFDCRGMGDSTGGQQCFELQGPDIGAAIAALMGAVPELKRVALWGLCDGASAALLYLSEQHDPRVAGLCLLNPWVRSDASLAKTLVKHYYLQHLMDRGFWIKLGKGQVSLGRAAIGLWRNVRATFVHHAPPEAAGTTPYQRRMARAWATFSGPTLLLMSDQDHTAKEFDEFCASEDCWRRALAARPPERVNLIGADHTCSAPEAQRAAEAATIAWAQRELASVA